MAGRERKMPCDRILDDPELSPGEKYRQLRAEYPTFGDSTIRMKIHERHPDDRPFSHLDELIEESDDGEPGAASRVLGLTLPEIHYFVVYRVWHLGLYPDQLGLLTDVVEGGACDHGTALFLYWAAISSLEPLETGEGDEDQVAEYVEWWRSRMDPFAWRLAERLKARAFVWRTIAYNPATDHRPEILSQGDPELVRPSPGEPFDEFAERP
jgi:hypothetical protein